MIESVTKQLNIMIKKQLLFILAVTTFGYVSSFSSPINGFMQGEGIFQFLTTESMIKFI
jgi:hypothetical protein